MKDNKEKLFTSYRWHEDVGAVSIGHIEQTEEERKKNREKFDKILKDRGIKK